MRPPLRRTLLVSLSVPLCLPGRSFVAVGAMSLVSLLFSSCCTALRPCWSLSFLVLVALLRGLVRLLAWPVPWFVWFRFLRCLPLAGLSVSLLSVGCFGALGLALLHAVLVHLYFLHLPVLLNSWASLYLCVCPLIGQVHFFFSSSMADVALWLGPYMSISGKTSIGTSCTMTKTVWKCRQITTNQTTTKPARRPANPPARFAFRQEKQ